MTGAPRGPNVALLGILTSLGCGVFGGSEYFALTPEGSPTTTPGGPWAPLRIEAAAFGEFDPPYLVHDDALFDSLDAGLRAVFDDAEIVLYSDPLSVEEHALEAGESRRRLRLFLLWHRRADPGLLLCLLMLPCKRDHDYELRVLVLPPGAPDLRAPRVVLDDYEPEEAHCYRGSHLRGRVHFPCLMHRAVRSEYPVGTREYVYTAVLRERLWLLLPVSLLWRGDEAETGERKSHWTPYVHSSFDRWRGAIPRIVDSLLAQLVRDLAGNGVLVLRQPAAPLSSGTPSSRSPR